MDSAQQPDFTSLAAHKRIDRPALLVLADWRRQGLRSALLSIVAIDGKSPRSIGAHMAVAETGAMHGYLTGGCLEGELAAVARIALANGRNETRRYGKGSPYIDMQLPCGSGIDVYFDQAIGDETVFQAETLLQDRVPFALVTELEAGQTHIRVLEEAEYGRQQQAAASGHFERLVKPGLRLDVYGAGYAADQLAYLAHSAGLDLRFFAGDDATCAAASALGLDSTALKRPGFTLPEADPWTASMLVFHEHEREIPILNQLVQGQSFYIGAIGSRLVSAQRRQALLDAGVTAEAIDRITMPAGLVRGARNATEIAIGVLAEILDRARQQGLAV